MNGCISAGNSTPSTQKLFTFFFFFLILSSLLYIVINTVHWFCFYQVKRKGKKKKKVGCFFAKEQMARKSKQRKLIYYNSYLAYMHVVICVPQAICFIAHFQPTYNMQTECTSEVHHLLSQNSCVLVQF